jgi:hypothetical protein
MDYSTIAGDTNSFLAAFKTELTTLLGCSLSQVTMYSATAGSVIVKHTLNDGTSGTEPSAANLDGTMINLFADKDSAMFSTNYPKLRTATGLASGATVACPADCATESCDPTTGSCSGSSSSFLDDNPWIMYLAAGIGALIVGGILYCCIKRCCCNSAQQGATAKFSAPARSKSPTNSKDVFLELEEVDVEQPTTTQTKSTDQPRVVPTKIAAPSRGPPPAVQQAQTTLPPVPVVAPVVAPQSSRPGVQVHEDTDDDCSNSQDSQLSEEWDESENRK